ncbi:UvrD-helicase domain-containing protein [Micromonospora sp. NPDC005298]|uniref:UvrD-helicase domain-containing protein n=1 Tax=Micromonospora sp. NPDC005298 TaxID=3156873 RepID=UPI0033A264A8
MTDTSRRPVILQILDRADKEILALSRADAGAVYNFQSKFRQNPQAHGLRLKQLKGSRLYSARVTDAHRAILLNVGERHFLLVSVRHRSDVYDDLDRYSYQINRVTGGIEVIDLAAVGDSIVGRLLPADDPAAVPEKPVKAPALFDPYTDQQLTDLGVAEPLLPSIRRLHTDDDLLRFADCVPALTADILLALHDGKTYDEVLDLVTTPVRADEPVDTDDWAAASNNPATQVTTDDSALQAILAESFARWQVFLHPTQRKVANHPYPGSARVSGGPGTGKTIVALHRVKCLAERLEPGKDKPILLTTFNRNLAADLRSRLLDLAGADLSARVDIVNIDKLASRIVNEAGSDAKRRVIDETAALKRWNSFLLELGECRFDAEFLNAEWAHIILGQAATTRDEYFRVRRVGRGKPITRDDRDTIWQITERFTKELDREGVWTWRQIAARAARLELDREARIQAAGDTAGQTLRYRYQHIVVDEAQDLSPTHWRLLRAMTPVGPDDMFITGDTHQRLYDNQVALSTVGINIRGRRSSRLTISYRTTREILKVATQLLTGETYDDLDGGTDTLNGYRSLLHGVTPTFRGAPTWAQERGLIIGQLRAWGNASDGSAAVCVPTRDYVNDVIQWLIDEGIQAVEIGPDGPVRPDGVHVGTMHRFKGLEYQRVIIAGASDGLVPRRAIDRFRNDDPKRYRQERARDRSRLFVAATRARDDLAVFWHGSRSPFIPASLLQQDAVRSREGGSEC